MKVLLALMMVVVVAMAYGDYPLPAGQSVRFYGTESCRSATVAWVACQIEYDGEIELSIDQGVPHESGFGWYALARDTYTVTATAKEDSVIYAASVGAIPVEYRPEDINRDCSVNVLDLLAWKANPTDVNGDGRTNVLDLIAIRNAL